MKAFFFEVPEEPTASTAQADTPHEMPEEMPSLALPDSKYKSSHKPFVKRSCASCHDPANQQEVREDFMDACQTCHERYFGDEVAHSPVGDGDCADCHAPHRSEFPALLQGTVSELCAVCHDLEDLSEDDHGEGTENCSACHDAHFGEEMLLKPGYAD